MTYRRPKTCGSTYPTASSQAAPARPRLPPIAKPPPTPHSEAPVYRPVGRPLQPTHYAPSSPSLKDTLREGEPPWPHTDRASRG